MPTKVIMGGANDRGANNGGTQALPIKNNVLDTMNPVGARIHDLCGPLTLFYFQNHHGPDRVEELSRFADPGEDMPLTCPISGKPYVCVSQGLMAKGHGFRIFMYDPEPHNGVRWCGVLPDKSGSSQSVVMYALDLPEKEFQKFTKASDHLLIP